jgi:hypothetical protein
LEKRGFCGAIGILTLTFDGKRLHGTLKEGDYDHSIEGSYNPSKRQFDVVVERVHRSDQTVQRKNQEVTFWVIGNDTLLYRTPNNGFGQSEEGEYIRKA